MLWYTHVVAGTAAGLLVGGLLNQSPEVVLTQAVIAGASSLLIDIDSTKSKIGRRVPIIPSLLQATAKHRGLVHSFVGVVFFTGLAYLLGNALSYPLWLPVMIGCLSHLAVDILNPMGCPLFWPISTKIKIPL